jgi:hypothetical protein
VELKEVVRGFDLVIAAVADRIAYLGKARGTLPIDRDFKMIEPDYIST